MEALSYLACPPLDAGRYGSWFTDTTIWRPYVEWVARRHGLAPPEVLSVGHPGSHPVFLAGGGYVVKFYAPHWPADARNEAAVYEWLQATPAGVLPHPARLAADRLFPGHAAWAWPYMVFDSMRGVPLEAAAAGWSEASWITAATTLGQIVRALHEMPWDNLASDLAVWSECERSDLARTAPDRRRREPIWARLDFGGWSAHWHEVLEESSRAPCLVHGDLTREHVFVEESSGPFQITGLIDWADARIGDATYELVSLYLDLFRGRPDHLAAFRSGYGDGPMFQPGWKRRATAFLLAYRFEIESMLAAMRPALSSATGIDQVEEIVWAGL